MEVPQIKQLCGDKFLTITPGIRLDSNISDDQARVVNVQQAQALGSDYIVVGRPITQAVDPLLVVRNILSVLYTLRT